MNVGRFGGCDRAAFASAGPACRAAVTHPARRLAVRAGPRRCFPVVGEGSSGGLDRERAGCRQRRDQDGSAPKALRLVIAALAGLLGGREERVQIAARPVQPKTVALQGETNGQTARSPTFMPEDPHKGSQPRHPMGCAPPPPRRTPANTRRSRSSRPVGPAGHTRSAHQNRCRAVHPTASAVHSRIPAAAQSQTSPLPTAPQVGRPAGGRPNLTTAHRRYRPGRRCRPDGIGKHT